MLFRSVSQSRYGGFAPIVGSADVAVFGNSKSLGIVDGYGNNFGLTGTGSADIGLFDANFGAAVGNTPAGTIDTTLARRAYGVTPNPAKSGLKGTLSNPTTLLADLSHSTPVTINALHQAFQSPLQSMTSTKLSRFKNFSKLMLVAVLVTLKFSALILA